MLERRGNSEPNILSNLQWLAALLLPILILWNLSSWKFSEVCLTFVYFSFENWLAKKQSPQTKQNLRSVSHFCTIMKKLLSKFYKLKKPKTSVFLFQMCMLSVVNLLLLIYLVERLPDTRCLLQGTNKKEWVIKWKKAFKSRFDHLLADSFLHVLLWCLL